jgi:protein-tyrosine phosphatase
MGGFHGITKVLFVCIGNVCRSPMASALVSPRLASYHPALHAESAGIEAMVGWPADPLAVSLLRERGVDISGHRARQLDADMATSFDLILVMDDEQQRAVEQICPPARGRVHRLGRFGGFDVPDPYRKPRAAFESSLALIERGIEDYVRAFWSAK